MTLPTTPAAPTLADQLAIVQAITEQNQLGFVNGLTAHSGGGQPLAFQLSQLAPLVQVAVAAAPGDSVALPSAIPGAMMFLSNSSGNIVNVFGQTNPNTGVQDSINASNAAFAMAINSAHLFFCPKPGIWAAI
jgi:hypothetical protein